MLSYSSSRGAESQTLSKWQERGTSPVNTHVPWSAVTASNWQSATIPQQHHGSFNAAGEREGGQQSQKSKFSINYFPICYCSPSKQADHALEKSAGSSFSEAKKVCWYIKLGMTWVHVHKKRLNCYLQLHFKCQLPDRWADTDNFQLFTDWRAGLGDVIKRQSSLYPCSAIQLSPQADFKLKNRNGAGDEFSSIPWSKIFYHLYRLTEYS